MTICIDIKKQLCSLLLSILDEKANTLEEAISAAKESRNNDTKSSAGDKFETGRAMMQMEIDKNMVQLKGILDQKKDLSSVSLTKTCSQMQFGSLVATDMGVYFFAVALGKINLHNKDYYAISLASPIGQALKEKKAGDEVLFQGRKISIIEIV